MKLEALGSIDSDNAVRFRIDADCEWLLQRWTWRIDPGNPTNGGKPYVIRHTTVNGQYRRIYLHREVLGLALDDPRKGDHINGDTLDCRRANLRIATVAQNAQNQGSRGGSSSHRGVTWDKSRQKWMASHMLDGRRTTIGRFETEQEAAEAASAWRALHMPFSVEARNVPAEQLPLSAAGRRS